MKKWKLYRRKSEICVIIKNQKGGIKDGHNIFKHK